MCSVEGRAKVRKGMEIGLYGRGGDKKERAFTPPKDPGGGEGSDMLHSGKKGRLVMLIVWKRRGRRGKLSQAKVNG